MHQFYTLEDPTYALPVAFTPISPNLSSKNKSKHIKNIKPCMFVLPYPNLWETICTKAATVHKGSSVISKQGHGVLRSTFRLDDENSFNHITQCNQKVITRTVAMIMVIFIG